MQKTVINHKNYNEFNDSYQLVMPLNLEGLIPEDDSVRLHSHILEGLNYTKLYQAYSHAGRKPAVEPQIMYKVITYAYSQNIYTSRKIEKACKRDINFRWLLAGNKAPDHCAISRFRQHYLTDEVMDDLFYQQIKYLAGLDVIQFENIFIDGTKREVNANRYTFVWKKVIKKNEEKMYPKIQELVKELNHEETQFFQMSKETIYNFGNFKMESRNSFSKTDTDATFMHMKDDHMRNAQLKPAYNVQIGVESEYIVGVGIFQDRNDIATLIPMMNILHKNLGIQYANVIADSGYESEENYMYLERNEQTPYIKPQTYEKWKKRSFKKDISKRENMIYNCEDDTYTCYNRKILKPCGIAHRKSATGYESEITIYECENCEGCKYKDKCTKSKGNRKMQVSKTFVEKRQASYENITTLHGAKLRMNRSIQVEGAFGVLKNDYAFNRFLTRGKNRVKTEFMLLSFGYNINKLHAKIQNERLNFQLHELKQSA